MFITRANTRLSLAWFGLGDAMRLIYQGNFNGPLLMDELLAVFPAWLYVEDGEQRCKLTLQVKPDGSGVLLEVPDDTDQEAVRSVISAHNGAALSASQRAEVERQVKMEALRKPWVEWTGDDQAEFLHLLAEQMGIIPVK
jgi:hypothetical protein